MEINGRTRVCGLLGNPVEHTLSPLIHNALAAQMGHNLVYTPFLVENNDDGGQEAVAAAIKGAYSLNILGLNVTVPYKSAVLPYLCGIDALAQKIGAVNTLVRTEGGYCGYNTDMTGLCRALHAEGIAIEGKEILLLGAGGAARAAAFMCAFYKAKRVYILNRTLEKAETVANEVNRMLETDCIVPMCLEAYKALPDGKYLAIQGTSVGLYPNSDRSIIEDKDFYRRIHTGYDLIYKPVQTRFMSLVEQAGGRAFNGLQMLLYQGIEAYELWNKTQISQEMAGKIYGLLEKEMEAYE